MPTMGKALIRWGSEYERDLEVGYPLADVATFRLPRADSERVRLPNGVEDAWVTGWDGYLSTTLRWVPWGPTSGSQLSTTPADSGWGGPTGLQAFLDYAREAGPFRFAPDASVPDFYADACYLDEPFNGGQPVPLPDGSFSIPLTWRAAGIDFASMLRGVAYEYVAGGSLTNPVTHTVDRDASGTYVNRGLSSASLAASDVLRDKHFVKDSQGVERHVALFEREVTNMFENGDVEADLDGFSASGGATVVRAAERVFYGSWSTKVVTANNAASGFSMTDRDAGRIDAVAGTAYTLSAWVYTEADAVGKTLLLRHAFFTAAEALIGSPTDATVVLVAGWQRVAATATAPGTTAFATPLIGSNSASGVWTFHADLIQYEATPYATTPVPTTTGEASRGDRDTISAPLPVGFQPQASFWYAKWVDLGTGALGTSAYVRVFGTRSQTGPAVRVEKIGSTTKRYHGFFNADSGSVDYSYGQPALDANHGDLVEFLVVLSATGQVTARMSVNGGTEVSNGPNNVGSPYIPKTWEEHTALINGTALGDTNAGWIGLLVAKCGPLTFAGRTIDTIAKAREA